MPPKKAPPPAPHLSQTPLALPSFLKMLASSGMSMQDSMSVASKMHGFKEYNTPAKLSTLTASKLTALKVDDKDQRTKVMAMLRKAGYKAKEAEVPQPVPEPELASSSPTPRKRRRDDDLAQGLSASVQGSEYGSLEFGEILEEDALKSRSVVINRAPIMAAWATIVAERIGFKREEALSIGSVYTEMNATSKGISLGIYERTKEKESAVGSAQPFVTLMDRKPVMQLPDDEWRGLIRGEPVEPAAAFGYIHRAMRQTLPYVMGAMRLLSLSFTPEALNNRGYALYCDFRPSVDGWGKRAEMRISDILALRPVTAAAAATASVAPGGEEAASGSGGRTPIRSTTVEQAASAYPARFQPLSPSRVAAAAGGPPSPPGSSRTGGAEAEAPERAPKRARRVTLDEYLDQLDGEVEEGAAPGATEGPLGGPDSEQP
ncbi:hypothetical protein CALCODRAFT_526375 [Calocera cornea HHB12733]|uniref:Uncharacterized protein n=1 Tax=Calocera cornea HHB12733 TaxID=1353952 RepID=A0A165KCQ1_9BASI|nr:hypothetical protein CALCODRAFT_526375 [Calocera cornea HHB12733]